MTFDELPIDYPSGFPHKKLLDKQEGRFGYIVPLTFGRARICVTTLDNLMGVTDFY